MYRKINTVIRLIDLVYGYFVQNFLRIRLKPRILQLPITGACNSRCKICRIWEKSPKIDIDSLKLGDVLRDPFFSRIHSIGLNGGEPSLYNNVNGLLDVLLSLKRLKQVYIITNGLDQEKILNLMQIIKKRCIDKKIEVYLTVSLDGIGRIHDYARGIDGAFSKVLNLINILKYDKKYCDELDVGCTISKHNVYFLSQLDIYMRNLGIPVDFHLAVPNRRLHNFDNYDFSVVSDKRIRSLATEFFYSKFKEVSKLKPKLRYFLTYYYLKNNGVKRIAGCTYLRRDITITENLDLYLCATASKKICNLQDKQLNKIIKDRTILTIEKEVEKYCVNCAHYILFPTVKGLLLFLWQLLNPGIIWLTYRVKSIWLK